ncbi:MAG TPA: tetratricopeptide repeat protein [Candidatus Omnitrophota bacterium]|nr:tetratricopeptide repeat protein [Candidatus Omnitrophota bacterium]
MKKTLLVLVGLLVAVYVVLTLVDTKSEYLLEKKLWRIQKDFVAIAQDPKAAPDNQYKEAIAKYRALIQKYPKARLTPQMYFQIGRLEEMRKNFDGARAVFKEASEAFKDNSSIVSDAMYRVGLSFEQEGKINDAIAIYREIGRVFSRTQIGFSMPIYIASIYRRLGDPVKQNQALAEAETFYRAILSETEDGSASQLEVLRALTTALLGQQKWGEAYQTLERTLFSFARSKHLRPQAAGGIVRTLSVVGAGQLNDMPRVMKTLETFKEQNPGHPLNAYLEQIKASLQQMKQEEKKAAVVGNE